MASRSSPSGRRPRRPGERTEKERRAPSVAAGSKADRAPTAASARSAGRHQQGSTARPRTGRPPLAGLAEGRPRAHREHQAGSDVSPIAVAGATLIYGRNPVREALRGRRRVHTIWLASEPGEDSERVLLDWIAEVAGTPPEVCHGSPPQLTSLAGSPDHQGMIASVDPYPYLEPEQILSARTLLVALDEVQDPHNLGAVIRTAEGAGAGVVIPRHRATEVTAAVVKAAAGATEHALVARVRNLADFLSLAKTAGFWVYGAAAGAAGSYAAQDYRYPTCFVLGSEGQGLGRRVGSLCDVMVSLPLAGQVESLNVSVSAGILLYEAVRQRAATEGPSAPSDRDRGNTDDPHGRGLGR